MDRRRFLKDSALGAMGPGIPFKPSFASPAVFRAESPLKIRECRRLGRTGFRASDIGCGICHDAGLLNAVLDAGVNYIDTAENYKNDRVIAQAIRDRDRKALFIATKLHIEKNGDKKEYLDRTRRCLERLRTDYLDCMLTDLVASGVEVRVCGTCIDSRGLKCDELIDEVIVGKMLDLARWVGEASKVLSF